MEAVTAFVLAGGKSIRMGTDKAFLKLEGKTLIEHALDLARAVAGEVRIIGAPAKFSAHGQTVPDIYPDRGPLGGIHAALAGSNTDLNLLLGVDLPFLDSRFLRYLISAADESKAVVTVPQLGGRYEPLCAVYRKEFASHAEKALAANQNKIDALFSSVPLRLVNDNELIEKGFSSGMFRNVNTPKDWKLAQAEFPGRNPVS